MRLSEKTLELNFCAQFAAGCPLPVLWYGLTQTQEAALGFDVAVRLGGTALLFQVKASRHPLARGGARRFRLPHRQLVSLRELVRPGHERRVFYAFPMVGTTAELSSSGGQVFGSTWLLDVGELAGVAAPTRRGGGPRRSEIHYADVSPPAVVVRSEPERHKLIPASALIRDLESIISTAEGEQPGPRNQELGAVARHLDQARRTPWGRLVAGVILRGPSQAEEEGAG